MENNINQLVQEIERIEGILTNRDLYGMGLNPYPNELMVRNSKLFNSVGKVIYDKYHPVSMESVVFEELLETKIAINIGAEEYKFYKSTIEKYKRNRSIIDCDLLYHDIVILDAYIELFHSISERAKDLVKTMITDSVEEALDISTTIESLCIIGINPNLEEIVRLYMDARKLINENKCANFKDAFTILVNVDINDLMEKKKQNAFVTPRDRILKLKQDNFELLNKHKHIFYFELLNKYFELFNKDEHIFYFETQVLRSFAKIDDFEEDTFDIYDIARIALLFNMNKYLKNGNFKNLSELHDLYINLVVKDDYVKNTLEVICRKIDSGEEIIEQNKEEIKNNMMEYLKSLYSQSIRNIVSIFSNPKLTEALNRLAGDKFKDLGTFIVNILEECFNEVKTRKKRGTKDKKKVKGKMQKARDIRKSKAQEIAKAKEAEIAQIREKKEIEEKRKREGIELKVHEERARREAEEQRIKAEKDIEIQKIREEMLKRKEEEKKAREKEMQKIIEEQQAEAQAKCIQLLDTEILQESESNQEANIRDFESLIHHAADSELPISIIYQEYIAGAIMFLTPKDPFEELFTEIDKIMSRSDNMNKKDEISNKMKELGNEINDFLGQISENDREKLKMYLSNPVLQKIFNEKTDNSYSKLILGQIITMMAGFEKNTRHSIY